MASPIAQAPWLSPAPAARTSVVPVVAARVAVGPASTAPGDDATDRPGGETADHRRSL
jgi:hypothetical protein